MIMELTIQQVEEFKNDPVWLELVKTWEERRSIHIDEIIETGDTDTMHFLRGQIKDLDFSMNQPDLILEELKEDRDTELDIEEEGDDDD